MTDSRIKDVLDDILTASSGLSTAVQALPGTSDNYGARLTAGGCSSFPNRGGFNSVSVSTGVLWLSYFRAPLSFTVGSMRFVTGGTAAGATPTLVRYGLYSVDGSGNLTLGASTANDTSLLAAAGTGYTKALSAGYALTAGSWYAAALLVVTGAAIPTMQGTLAVNGTGAIYAEAPRVAGAQAGQTDLPASVAVGSVADTGSRIVGSLIP